MKKNKEHLLKVARKVISAKGFKEASTRDIAKEANVSQGLINYHFGTKENLLNEILSDYVSQVEILIKELNNSEENGLRLLNYAVKKLFKLSFDHRDVERIINLEGLTGIREHIIDQKNKIQSAIFSFFLIKITEGQEQEYFDPMIDEELVVSFLMNALNNYVIQANTIIIKTPKHGISSYSEHHRNRVMEFCNDYLAKMLNPKTGLK